MLMRLAVLAALLVAFSSGVFAQTTPFGTPAPSGETAQAGERTAPAPSSGRRGEPSLAQEFWLWVNATQRALHRQLAHAVGRLKSGGWAAAWMLASLSFVYGVVHAIGPGHGKAVISSYMLANERTVRRGILLSFLASIVQALSAALLVAVLAVALNAAGLRIKAMAAQLETASYALIALVGAWLLVSQLRRRFVVQATARPLHDAPMHGHDHHGHGHHGHGADCCGHAHMPDPKALGDALSWRKAAAIVFAVGVRPCTGAVIVLVFALANGLFAAGVAATFAMALGTAITVSALAVLAVGSKQLALHIAGGSGYWAGRVSDAMALGGALLVLLLGVALFMGSLGPARPF